MQFHIKLIGMTSNFCFLISQNRYLNNNFVSPYHLTFTVKTLTKYFKISDVDGGTKCKA